MSRTLPTGKESPTMTQIAADGEVAVQDRSTPTMHYPLPPEPPRFQPTWNRYRQYQLPSPTTGRPTAFARASTVAKVMDDRYNLELWIQRKLVSATLEAKERVRAIRASLHTYTPTDAERELDALVSALDATPPTDQKYNAILDQIDNLAGGKDAQELGTAVHAWLEAVDIGQVRPCDVPEQFQPYLTAYRAQLTRHGLEPVAAYVERIVLNDQGAETVVGTIDRIYRIVATGELVMGDLKTSKSLEYSWLEYGIQVGGVYAGATLMLKADGSGWELMPTVRDDFAVLVHVPSDQPERASVVTFDIGFCEEAYHHAIRVRDLRRRASKEIPFVHAIPTPTPEALRYVQARHAIQDISDPSELSGIWEQYSDVWDESLTELGKQTAALFG